MAAVNADRGPTKEGISVDSTAAIKSNHRVGANGESHATNGVVTNGQSHSEISGLRVTLRPRPIQLTPRYRDGFRRTNQDALDATTSMKSFFDFVANDRLRRMPHKGSRWDKILRWAEYFAAQVSLYHESVGPFVSNSEETAQLLWASCRILLQLGPKHVDALEKIIGVFFKFSLTMSSILQKRNRSLFTKYDATQDELTTTYSKLLIVVVEITTAYHKRLRSSSSNADDLDKLFGKRIDSFFYCRDQVSNTLWACQLERSVYSQDVTMDMRRIRDWLSPQDRILRLISSDVMNSRGERDEFTCEWFQTHLVGFTRSSEDIFLVTGSGGSGKSFLSSWIEERLQRTLERKTYAVISVTIDATISSEAAPLSVLKHLVLQSLEQNVGNVSLYKLLSSVLEMSAGTENGSDIEDALWKALDQALKTDENILLILDGLDQITGGEAIRTKFLDRIYGICVHHPTVKCIVLTKPLSKPFSKPARHLSIQSKHIHQDLCHVVDRLLAPHPHFHDRKEDERRQIVHRITDGAKDSFVLVDLTIQLLLREETHEGFTRALNNLPKSVPDAIQRLTSQLDLTAAETKLMLSWLLVTERPLSLREIQSLLEIETSTIKYKRTRIDVEEQIRRTCGSLLQVRDGIVRFRHVATRQYLDDLSKAGKYLFRREDAHRELTYRCLAYTNTHISSKTQCTTTALSSAEVEGLFQTHYLLEYAARYWTKHFCGSPMYRQNGKHEITSEFHHYFSRSVLQAQIEWACWDTQSSIKESLEMHRFALNLRKIIFTESHETVLQTLITIARTYEKITNTTEACTYYYEASKLSRAVCGPYSEVTTTCAEAFLTATTTIVTTTRTETITRREEMLQVIIASHENHHGHSSEEVIRYKKQLAQLYTQIQETTLAIRIYRELYEACVEFYGEFHEETTTVCGGLAVVLQGESRYEDVLIYLRLSFKRAEENMDLMDIRRIRITLQLIEFYESRNELTEAEELLITLWRKISITCHTRRTITCHERKIEVTLAYVQYLRRQSRCQEAENILRGLWIDYEHEDLVSGSLIVWIKRIGEHLHELQILDVAVKVYTAVWTFYKKIHREDCHEAVLVAIVLAEITIMIRHEGSLTEETSYSEELIMKTVYESTIKTITTTKITTSTVKTCETLTSYYVKTERWSEALTVCHEVLKGLWLSVTTEHGALTLPREFTGEAVDMAIRMAHCHRHVHQFEKAEKLLLRVFRATKYSLRIQDELVTKAVNELVLYYESVEKSQKVIDLYVELLADYSYTLGRTHVLTVKALYLLGALCIKHGRKGAEKYYLEICTNYDKHLDICHHEAIEAALALIRIYESEKRWTDTQKIYSFLWRTLLKRTEEYQITAERVEEIYRRYFYVLEKELKVSYTVLRQITIEFRTVCVSVYGSRSEIALRACIHLAEINERSETHVHEAIQIYEEVFRETRTITETTTTTTTTIVEAKSRLTRLYVKHSSTSPQYISKALSMYMERFENVKVQFGCSHDTTLSQLEELVVFYKSRKDLKLTATVIRTLQATIIEIITKEKDSRRLFDSSTRIARIYMSHGHTEEAKTLLVELRRQIISRDLSSCEKLGFKFDQQLDRRSFVFLATFEETLKGFETISFSEIMADFLTETIMIEAYTRALTEKTRFETVMVHGARLRYFRRSKYNDVHDSKIDDDLFDAFIRNMGSSITTPKNTTREFFRILLEETGKSQHEIHLVKAGSYSGAAAVRTLLEQSKFQDALDLATCVWQFAKSQEGFNDQEIISSSFKIALYLAGRRAKKCNDNLKLRQNMMDLSGTYVEEILKASRRINIDFTKTPIEELNELVSLLGEQKNFTNLEWILTQLWNSRHTQTTWSSSTVVSIGRRLVEARFDKGDHKGSISLLEDICYNLRRVWGSLDKTTLQMHTLLSELYTADGRYAKAMSVHEEILWQEINGGDGDNDAASAADVKVHLELLKCAHQRLGGWDKDPKVYTDLFHEVMAGFKGQEPLHDIQPIAKWPSKGADDKAGVYVSPSIWNIMETEDEKMHSNWLWRTSGVHDARPPSSSRNGAKRGFSGLHTFTKDGCA